MATHSDLWYCFLVSLGLDVEFGKGDFWAKKIKTGKLPMTGKPYLAANH